MDDEVLYRGRVRARVRRDRTSFFTLKNAFTGIYAEIRSGEIKVIAPGVPEKLARLLGVYYALPADSVTVSEGEVGWLGTRIDSGPCLLIEGQQRGRAVELALRPLDGDVARLRQAVRAACASPQGSSRSA